MALGVKEPKVIEGTSLLGEELLQRRRAEEALRESEEKYRGLVERANDGIVIIQDKLLKYVNPRLEEISGYSIDELIDTPFTDYIDPDEPPRVLDRYQRRMAGQDVPPVYETILRRKDGRKVYAELNAGVITYQGKSADLVIVRDITERKKAEEEIRHRIDELATLNEIGRAIASTMKLDELWELIYQQTCRVMEVSAFYIALHDQEKGELHSVIDMLQGKHRPQRERSRRFAQGRTECIIRTRQPLLIRGDVQETYDRLGIVSSDKRARAFAGVPLIASDEVIGVLAVQNYERHDAYDGHTMHLLSTIADQAAIAIENVRLFEEAQARSAYLATLLQVNATLRSTLPLKQVLETITRGTAEALGYLGCFVALPDARGERLIPGVAWGGRIMDALLKVTQFKLDSFSVPVKVQENLIARAFATGELQTSSGEPESMGVGVEPAIGAKMARAIERIAEAKGAACVPLRVAAKTIGVLIVLSPRQKLSDEERTMLLGLADQAAIAIENARLFEGERGRATQLALINEVGEKAVSILDLDRLMQEVTYAIQEKFDYYDVALFLVDKERHEAVMEAVAGGFERIVRGEYRQPWDQGIIGRVITTGRSWLADDVSQDPYYVKGFSGEVSTESELCVPIRLGDEVIGALDIQSIHLNAFDETDVTAMETLSGQLAIAIQNARLYGDLQAELTERKRVEEEVRRRSEELTVLNNIGMAVTGTLDLQEVLQTIQKRTRELLGEKYGPVFALFNEADQTLDVTLTHVQEDVVRRVDKLIGMKFEELPIPLASLKPALREALLAGKPHVANDVRDFFTRGRGRRLFKGTQIAMGVKGIVALPLWAKGRLIGTMLLFSQREKIPEGEIEFLSGIANQAAIAIENARSYERLKEQNLHAISALAAAVEAKDAYTGGHSENVTRFAVVIAERMGFSDDAIEDLQVAALLHDIGKIGIPDDVLNKPARLTSAEFLMIQAHPAIAAEIVGRVESLTHIVPIIRHHHERWDGTGYPDGLKGEEIPLLARILAVADSYDAMTSERPYRGALSEEEVLRELEKGAGSQWDPKVVEVLVRIVKEKGARSR